MKKISIYLASLLAITTLATSCNDEWSEEQYEHYVSFKAPLDDNGVTAVYVPFTRHNEDGTNKYGEGESSYQLPVIVSGSTTNSRDVTVYVAHDTDTLGILNYERFQMRDDLYYKDMTDYAEYPESATIKSGSDVGLLDIRFHFNGIDMVDKWVLPIKIVKSDVGYAPHPRKHYAKAMLRIYPFNDYSGDYSATTLMLANSLAPNEAIGMKTSRAYVVDENTVFFYMGNIDETRSDRNLFKVYCQFSGDEQGTVRMWSDNPKTNFQYDGKAAYRIYETMDGTKPYMKHRYVIINSINYTFDDYSLAQPYTFSYTVSGTLTLERKINTQIPDEDQAFEWD